MATIYWAGDSTVQYNDILTYPQTGIGQVMGLFLKPRCVFPITQRTEEAPKVLLTSHA